MSDSQQQETQWTKLMNRLDMRCSFSSRLKGINTNSGKLWTERNYAHMSTKITFSQNSRCVCSPRKTTPLAKCFNHMPELKRGLGCGRRPVVDLATPAAFQDARDSTVKSAVMEEHEKQRGKAGTIYSY